MPPANLSQMIFESMSDGVVCLDAKGRVTDLNPAAAEILGFTRQEARGLAYPELFFQSEVNDPFNQMVLDLVYSQENRPYEEVPFERPDGGQRQLALATNLLRSPEDGSHQGAVLVFKDISKVTELRQQRDQLSQELAQKHEKLRQAYLELDQRSQGLAERQRRLFWIKLVSGACGLLMFAAVGWFMYEPLTGGGSGPGPERLDSLPAPEEGGKLRPFQAKTGDLSLFISSAGALEPIETVSVSARVSGRVVFKGVELGQRVKKGEVLYRLSQAQVLPKLRQARAAQMKAGEELDQLTNWARRPETKQAQRAVKLAQMELEHKQDRLTENQQLFKQGVIPANELESARGDMVRAQAALADAQERLRTALERGSRQKLTVARLEYENAQASLKDAQQKLADTEITAPVDGVIMRPKEKNEGGNRQADLPPLGAMLNEGANLLTLGVDRQLGVQAMVSEADIAKVALGMPVLVSTQALKGRELPGVVRAVELQARRTSSGTMFAVSIALDRLPQEVAQGLRLGMSAQVRIIAAQAKGAILVPVVAVAQRPQGIAVRVKEGQGHAWRAVELGINDAEFVQVKKGLQPGETVYY